MPKNEEQAQGILPFGAQVVEDLRHHPAEQVRALVDSPAAQAIVEATIDVMSRPPELGFLHSALCAMSLPVRRPKDEFAPIVRQDGRFTLVLKPTERVKNVNGEVQISKVGVPFGVHARLILLYIMSEAVRTGSREVFLGKSFSDFLRRVGIENTGSGGRRGTRNLVQEQIDRLMACEWTIRFDSDVVGRGPANAARKGRGAKPPATISTFAVNDVRIASGYSGVVSEEGEFVTRFILSEQFFETLKDHRVPFNERAYGALKSSATRLDLYTFLAYRLPRIPKGETVQISWEGMRTHLGNDSSTLAKFKQTVRQAWDHVSGVYPQARFSADFSRDDHVSFRWAPSPHKEHLVLLPAGGVEIVSVDTPRMPGAAPRALAGPAADPTEAADALRWPGARAVRYHGELAAIARDNSRYDIDLLASSFEKKLGDELETLSGERLRRRFSSYCAAWGDPR